MPRSVRKGGGLANSKPDDPEGSFSFQIPTSMRQDYLLADDGESFFQGAGDILATPLAPRADLDRSLTIGQLTTGPSARTHSNSSPPSNPSAGSSESKEDNPPLRRSPRKKKHQLPESTKQKPVQIRRATLPLANPPSPPTPRQLEGEIQESAPDKVLPGVETGFPSNSPKSIPLPTRRGKEAPERQHKASRLSRPKRSKLPVAEAIEDLTHAVPSLGRVTEEVACHAESSSSGSAEARSPAVPAAVDHAAPVSMPDNEELAEQCAMREVSPMMAEPTQAHAEGSPAMVVDTPPSTSAISTLTVSQLSPQKPKPQPVSVDAYSGVSLVVSASKRPAEELDDDPRPQKRAKKNSPAPQSIERTGVTSSTKGSSASASRRLSGSRSRPATTAGRPGAVRPRAAGTLAPTRSTKRRSFGSSKSRAADPSAARAKTTAAPRLSLKARLQMKSVSGTSDARPQGPNGSISNQRSVMRATVPHAFTFQVDTRLEARKSQSDKVDQPSNGSKSKVNHAIPDFKALHAAHEAELALRKENIHPIVPVPPKFETDTRMKERHKFEEYVREKELRRHLEQEQKRKERQEWEEEEIRELRKKAIPKAHEVPEWYKDAPKKAKMARGV